MQETEQAKIRTVINICAAINHTFLSACKDPAFRDYNLTGDKKEHTHPQDLLNSHLLALATGHTNEETYKICKL